MTILASYAITSGSQSVDIPTGTQAVAFVWACFYSDSGDGLASATLDGEAFDSAAELAGNANDLAGGYALWTTGPNIGTGLTFAHTFDDPGNLSNGPTRFLVCMGDLSTTALRDTTSIMARAGSATNASVTVDTQTGDEIIVFDAAYDTVAPATGTGYTSLQSQANVLNVSGRLKWITGSGSSLTVNSETDEYPFVIALVFQPVTATLVQEGFRFGLDDGSESAHTWSQSQDVDETTALSVTRLLRMLVDATGDPSSTAYTLRYQKNGTGGYLPVQVGSSTSPTLSWGAAGTIAYSAASGTSVAPTYPTGITTDSCLVLVVGQKPTTANGGTVTTPSGWTLRGSLEEAGGYGATLAADTGNTNVFVYTKDTVAGTESGTLSVTVSDNNVCWANIYRIQSSALCTWSFDFGSGEDTSAGNVSIATGNVDIAAGDHILAGMVIPTDVTTPAQFSAQALSQSGTTFGTVSEVEEPDSGTGNDIGGFIIQAPVSSGSGTGAVTMTATAGGTTTNVRGPGFVLRVRATGVTNQVYVSASANIAAGGEATTARLTAPSGKSTSDFVTGRRWDDENGTDSIDITADDYTEVEWCLTVQSPAVNTDYFDFRVYAGSTALSTYTEEPRWTISTGGAAASFVPPHHGRNMAALISH